MEITLAALKAWTHWLVMWIALVIILGYVLAWLPIGVDDTDKDSMHRSDMKIYTDHKTGCQYLGTSKGGLTPRLDENGKHMCKKDG